MYEANVLQIMSPLRPETFSRKERQSGFTLVELVFVIVFLSVAVLASMQLMSSSLSGSFHSEHLVVATDLASEKLEQIMADKNSRGYGYVAQSNYAFETNVNGNIGFDRGVTITDLGTSKQVQVTVYHPKLDDVTMVAFITNY